MGNRRNGLHLLFSILIGAALALLLGLVFRIGVFFSLLAGVGGLIAGLLIFRNTGSEEDEYLPGISGITKEMHRKELEAGRIKLAKLRACSIRIEDREIKGRADKICDLTVKMLENIRKDPKDLKPARPFLNYYLDTAITIVTRYTEISVHPARSRESDELLSRVGRTLAALETAFEKQLTVLLDNDLMDLDTELTVLETTITMEGFGKKEMER